MDKQKTVAVIGAGISGLSVVYWLKKNGFDVSVFESTDHIGGSIITENDNGFLIDLGPNSTLETSQVLTDLVAELDLEKQKVYGNESANKRYIVRDGKLQALPMSALGFIKTKLFSTRAKLRLMREPFIKRTTADDISLADFVRNRLGPEFLDYAINPFVAGVYAGDPENLSTPAAFPKLWALEQNYGSFIKGTVKGARERKKSNEVAKDRAKLFSFLDGMSVFPEALAGELQDRINLNSTVTKIDRDNNGMKLTLGGNTEKRVFDIVVSTAPGKEMKGLLSSVAPEESNIIGAIKYPPVAVVYLGFKAEQILRDIDGFGFLVPKVENRQILGSIWSSSIFPNRAPDDHVAFTTFVGGTRQPEIANLEESEMIKIVLQELNALVGIKGDPLLTRIKLWPLAIPQYTMGYEKIQNLFTKIEDQNPGLYFAGNYRRGISVGDSVLCAHETVTKILNEN